MDFKNPLEFGKIKPQRKGPVRPAGMMSTDEKLSDNMLRDQNQQDGHSFEEELEEHFDFDIDLPDILQEDYDAIVALTPFPEPIIYSKVNEFHSVGLSYLQEINHCYLIGNTDASSIEYKLSMVAHVLFIILSEYGELLALQKLVEIWGELSEDSPISRNMYAYLYLILTRPELPLTLFNQSAPATERAELLMHKSVQIKMKCRDLLSHNISPEKAAPLLEAEM